MFIFWEQMGESSPFRTGRGLYFSLLKRDKGLGSPKIIVTFCCCCLLFVVLLLLGFFLTSEMLKKLGRTSGVVVLY